MTEPAIPERWREVYCALKSGPSVPRQLIEELGAAEAKNAALVKALEMALKAKCSLCGGCSIKEGTTVCMACYVEERTSADVSAPQPEASKPEALCCPHGVGRTVCKVCSRRDGTSSASEEPTLNRQCSNCKGWEADHNDWQWKHCQSKQAVIIDELRNLLKVTDRSQRYIECRSDLLDSYIQEMLESRHHIADLQAQLVQWETWGIIEISIRNSNVASYVTEWESRAAKAEADLAYLRELRVTYAVAANTQWTCRACGAHALFANMIQHCPNCRIQAILGGDVREAALQKGEGA